MSASADVESQSPAARPRSRCLDTFLTVSVIALFVMFLAAVASALLFVKHIENEINERTTRESTESTDSATFSRLRDIASSSYKMQNFAYLEATESHLKTGVMPWRPVRYGESQSIGSLYSFSEKHEALDVNESGSYFLYVQLNFSCLHICPSGQFTVSFYNHQSKKFTCTVSLPSQPQDGKAPPVSQTCWHVITFPEKTNRLLARAEFQDTLDNWKLELSNSGFGIFLIDGLPAAHRT